MPNRRFRAHRDDRRFRQAPTTLDPAMDLNRHYYVSTIEDENLLLVRPAFPHSKRCQRDQIVELSASVSEQQDALLREREDPLSAARGICFGLLLLGFWGFAGLVLWTIW